MYIEFHDHLGNPQRVKATRVVVYDDFSNPYAVACSYDKQPGVEQLFVSALGLPDFQTMLQNLGIYQTTIVTDFSQKPITEISFDR